MNGRHWVACTGHSSLWNHPCFHPRETSLVVKPEALRYGPQIQSIRSNTIDPINVGHRSNTLDVGHRSNTLDEGHRSNTLAWGFFSEWNPVEVGHVSNVMIKQSYHHPEYDVDSTYLTTALQSFQGLARKINGITNKLHCKFPTFHVPSDYITVVHAERCDIHNQSLVGLCIGMN
jgi:hypothetical protein